jgi:TATA-box binding protein (TBP) (component of TFIID and TFIIIB)
MLSLPWDRLWSGARNTQSKEELASECMGIEKWNPPCDMVEPFIHNVVSTSKVHSLHMPIRLDNLALLLKNSTYDKKRFAAITIRTCNPFCTALLFTSGKLVVTGVQSFYECVFASLSIMKIINAVYPLQSFKIHDCVVQNMVAHSTFNLDSNQRFDIQVRINKSHQVQ